MYLNFLGANNGEQDCIVHRLFSNEHGGARRSVLNTAL